MPNRKKTPQQIAKALGAELKNMRIRAGLTQTDLGRTLKRTQRLVSWAEFGTTQLSFAQVLAWCDACDGNIVALAKRLKAFGSTGS